MKTIMFAVSVLVGSCANVSFAAIEPMPPATQVLIQAPIIVYADITDIPGGQFPNAASTVDRKICRTALARVGFGIKGSVTNGVVAIRQMLDPSLVCGWLSVDTGKCYVLFLTPATNTAYLEGIDRCVFTLESDRIAAGQIDNLKTEDALRLIARVNMASTNERVAFCWTRFLSEVFDKKDEEVFQQQLSSTHVNVRGTAIATLCKHTVITPVLSAEAKAFLKTTNSSGTIRYMIAKSLVSQRKCTDEMLREWLASGDSYIWHITVRTIEDTRNANLLPDLLNYLQHTSNVLHQYNCISAINAIDAKNGLPATDVFVRDPSAYVREVLGRHSAQR